MTKKITCLATIHAIPSKKQELIKALNHVMEQSKKEEGCMDYQVLIDRNQPNSLLLLEVYKSKAYFDKHFETDHVKWFMNEIKSKTCEKIYHDLFEEAIN